MRIVSASILSAFLLAPAAWAGGLRKTVDSGPIVVTVTMVGADRSGQKEFPSLKVAVTEDTTKDYNVRGTIVLADKEGAPIAECPFMVIVQGGKKEDKWGLRECTHRVAEYLEVDGLTFEEQEPLAPPPDLD